MQCANGHEIAEHQKFCPECGVPVPPAETVSHVVEPTQILPPYSPEEALDAPEPAARHGWRSLPRAAKWSIVAAAVIVIVGSGTAAALLTDRSSEPGVSTWMCSGSTSDLLIQWPDTGAVINGTYQDAELTGTAPDQQVSTARGDVTGQLSGDALTINIDNKGDWYGSIRGNKMTLNIPEQNGTIQPATCQHSTLAAWNQTIANLGSQNASANASASAAAAQAQQQQDLANAQQTLATDVQQLASDAHTLDTDKTLAGDVQTARTDLTTEQQDGASEQSDSCSNLANDANTVSNDANTVSNDVATITNDTSSIADSLKNLELDLSTVLANITYVTAAGGTPQTDPTGPEAAGKRTVTDTQKALAWAAKQGQDLTTTSQSLDQQASNFADAHGC